MSSSADLRTLPAMHAAALRIEIRVPESRSLKAKRAVLRPAIARLERMRVAVAEVGHQNAWQLATIGAALVAPQRSRLDELVAGVKHALFEDPRLEVLEVAVSYLERP